MSHDSAAYEQQLSEMLDGRLPADEEQVLREHLQQCPICQREYEAMKLARKALRATPPPRVPEGLLARIQRDAADEMQAEEQPTIWSRFGVPAAAAAAAAALLLAVYTPWQALHPDRDCETACPSTEPPTIAAEPMTDQPDETTVAADTTPAEPVAETDSSEAEAAGETMLASRPDTSNAPSVVPATVATSNPEAAEETVQEAEEADSAPEQEIAEPALALAPPPEAPSTASAGPVLDEPEKPAVVAPGPRTTVDREPGLDPAHPSELEKQMATGVVAGMLVDQFVSEHMVEKSSTLLAVVTDTPTSELGPAVATDEESNFGVCFTEAMRQALTESENQLP